MGNYLQWRLIIRTSYILRILQFQSCSVGKSCYQSSDFSFCTFRACNTLLPTDLQESSIFRAWKFPRQSVIYSWRRRMMEEEIPGDIEGEDDDKEKDGTLWLEDIGKVENMVSLQDTIILFYRWAYWSRSHFEDSIFGWSWLGWHASGYRSNDVRVSDMLENKVSAWTKLGGRGGLSSL